VSLQAYANSVVIGVTGLYFLDTPDLAVRIADWVQTATFVNATYATFRAPPVREVGRYAAFLTTNRADFTEASSVVALTYHPGFVIERLSNHRVQVSQGPAVGLISHTDPISHISLTAWGSSLPKIGDEVDLYCVFGPSGAAVFPSVTVRATFTSDDGTSIRCDDVPTAFTLADGTPVAGAYDVLLRFSYDLQELVWPQTLLYYPAPVLQTVTPARLV